MLSMKDLPCWEIMKCEDSEGCLARKHPDSSCWDLARGLNDFRVEYDVCVDCIVYMLKNDNLVMSLQEINEARQLGATSCALAGCS